MQNCSTEDQMQSHHSQSRWHQTTSGLLTTLHQRETQQPVGAKSRLIQSAQGISRPKSVLTEIDNGQR